MKYDPPAHFAGLSTSPPARQSVCASNPAALKASGSSLLYQGSPPISTSGVHVMLTLKRWTYRDRSKPP
jgi:hypothetical protein